MNVPMPKSMCWQCNEELGTELSTDPDDPCGPEYLVCRQCLQQWVDWWARWEAEEERLPQAGK